jgi:16S rRNA G527 N7-methylase RsmG
LRALELHREQALGIEGSHVSRETEVAADQASKATLISTERTEIEFPAALFERLEAYGRRVLEANLRINLVSRRDPETQILNNILDALPILLGGPALFGPRGKLAERGEMEERGEASDPVSRETEPPLFLIDAGSGSGLPGVPIRMGLDHLPDYPKPPFLLLIESRERKAYFLLRLLEHLELPRAEAFHLRLESTLLPEMLSERDLNGGGIIVARALASIDQTFKWSRGIADRLEAALFIKGGPGLLREFENDPMKWKRRGWQLRRHESFHFPERKSEQLTFDRISP